MASLKTARPAVKSGKGMKTPGILFHERQFNGKVEAGEETEQEA